MTEAEWLACVRVEDGEMQSPPNNLALPLWFVFYAGVTGLLYWFLPCLLGRSYLMPWHYWWVFLFITPPLAGGLLGWQVQRGKYTKLGVLVFVLAALMLGLFYRCLSYYLGI
jgi:hypothetical protein